MIDALAVRASTGWTVIQHEVVGSTNDEAARLRDSGAAVRTVVVAERQTAGRGRGSASFASPPGGLYASLLLEAGPGLVPGPLTAAVALAAAQAVSEAAGVEVQVKWPNDLWIRGRKVGGILMEASGDTRPVVAGIGINVARVPDTLPEGVRAATTALGEEASGALSVEGVLAALLRHVDARCLDLRRPGGLGEVEEAWKARLALRGERIRYRFAGEPRSGTFLDASLTRGLLVRDDREGEVWRRSEHCQEVRPEAQ